MNFTKEMINFLPLHKNEKLFNEIRERSITIISEKKLNYNYDSSALEKQIDQLVYELYGLTEEEIAIVEGANC